MARRVLIIKMSSIGDVVSALPVAAALKRQDPATHVTWAAEDWTAPLLDGHPDIDRVVVFPRMRWSHVSAAWLRRFASALRELRSQPYDVSIDLQGLARSAVLALAAGATRRIVSANRREGAGLISRPVVGAGRLHATDEYLLCARALGADDEPAQFRLPISAAAARSVAERLAALGVGAHDELIVVNPSASRPYKTWDERRWSELIDALPAMAAVALVGDASQVRRHRAIAAGCARPPIDLTGSTHLSELIALLARCTVHVAPDTGSVHIAAALGTPVVGLYGPTDSHRHRPYGQADPRHGLARPCGILCPRFCARRPCLSYTTPAQLARLAGDLSAAAGSSGGSAVAAQMRSDVAAAGIPPRVG